MAKCKVCGKEVERVYGGKCSECLSIEAIEEDKYLDEEHDVSDLQINTPSSDEEIIEIIRNYPR